jgi:hypothetical protein
MLGRSVLDANASAARCPQLRETAESALLTVDSMIIKRKREESLVSRLHVHKIDTQKGKRPTKNESGTFSLGRMIKLKGEK